MMKYTVGSLFIVLAIGLSACSTPHVDTHVGEHVATMNMIPNKIEVIKIRRYLLATTPEGYYKVQDFYYKKNGNRHGPIFGSNQEHYYPNTQAYTDPYYLTNKSDLSQIAKIEYDEDQSIQGNYKQYDIEGNVALTGQYNQGKRVGTWRYYDDGKLVRTEHYNHGKLQQDAK